jgi:hypothetical protein
LQFRTPWPLFETLALTASFLCGVAWKERERWVDAKYVRQLFVLPNCLAVGSGRLVNVAVAASVTSAAMETRPAVDERSPFEVAKGPSLADEPADERNRSEGEASSRPPLQELSSSLYLQIPSPPLHSASSNVQSRQQPTQHEAMAATTTTKQQQQQQQRQQKPTRPPQLVDHFVIVGPPIDLKFVSPVSPFFPPLCSKKTSHQIEKSRQRWRKIDSFLVSLGADKALFGDLKAVFTSL